MLFDGVGGEIAAATALGEEGVSTIVFDSNERWVRAGNGSVTSVTFAPHHWALILTSSPHAPRTFVSQMCH